MVNNQFYATINSLTKYFTEGGSFGAVIDYHSFVDAGRVLQDMEPAQLHNGFLLPLMNKVQATVDTFRSYDPALPDMFQGESNFGVVEILTHTFYNTRQAPFIGLSNTTDDSMIDFKKPEIDVRYYDDTDAWQSYISVSDTELRGAWRSPEAMDGFIQSLLGDMANTNRLHREVARLNLLCAAVGDIHSAELAAAGTVKISTANKTGRYIDLVAVYNDIYGEGTVTADTALNTPEFVRWAVSYVNQFRYWLEKPNERMNATGIKTFTPRADQRLKISSLFDSAIRRSLWSIYHTDGALLDDYEVLAYWQANDAADSILAGQAVEGGINTPLRVAAVLYDNYALMEYKDLESVSSERNNKKLYNTYYYNYTYRYLRNPNANFVMFTLG